MEGWIKLHRKFLTWEWYQDSQTLHLFLHLLISACHKESNWEGITLNRGQVITGRKSLSKQTGISERTVRSIIKRLKSTSEISVKTTNKFSIITINNYDSYQNNNSDSDQQKNEVSDQQVTSNRPATDHKQECKELKNVKNNIEERAKKFYNEVFSERNIEYGQKMLQNFYDYWTEQTHDGTQMRFELQKTFDTARRLKSWARHEEEFLNEQFIGKYHATDF